MSAHVAQVRVVCPGCGAPHVADVYVTNSHRSPREIRFQVDLVIVDPDDCADTAKEEA